MPPPIDFTDPFAPSGALQFGGGVVTSGGKPIVHQGCHIVYAPNWFDINTKAFPSLPPTKRRRLFVS